jgi:hypothetical protein
LWWTRGIDGLSWRRYSVREESRRIVTILSILRPMEPK